MTSALLPYWLTLNHAPGLGSASIAKLLDIYKSPENIVKDKINSLAKFKLSEETLYALTHPDQRRIEAAHQWIEQTDQSIITLDDSAYPRLLKEIPDPPPVLYIKGDTSALSTQQLAIVGSRNPSVIGKEIATAFAHTLSEIGLVITSGLALGIDAAAHRGALNANGQTIAVLGSGLNHIYPKSHRKLAANITESGCLVSEFPLDAAPRSQHFPQRNRIISGLSLGTLVVEAKQRSGSLITARLANEQGREVFAIPGSLRNPLAHGCHRLIQNGAKLVETIDDITEELRVTHDTSGLTSLNDQQPAHVKGLEKAHRKLLECVDFEVTSIDRMIARSQFSASTVTTLLLILELHGYISPVPGGYRRIK